MKFVEMTGRSLFTIVSDDEISSADLAAAGVTDETVVRVNQHGISRFVAHRAGM